MNVENETGRTGPVKTFRQGAIGASVWERSGKKGTFYEFTVSRSYKGADGKSGYAHTFHAYDPLNRVTPGVRAGCRGWR